MKREEMTMIVNEELKHIPTEYDNVPQKILRMAYNMVRRNFLKNGMEKEQALLHCIETVKQKHPTWIPKYDRVFFRV